MQLPIANQPFLLESWIPLEINELDEMERIQSLKQRENLLKGMGITDFVNRILYGTPGTVATVPPSLSNPQPNPAPMQGKANNTDANQGSENVKNGPYNTKYEIKSKNFNPFENHSLFTEVISII